MKNSDVRKLAVLIADGIKEDFEEIHLSGNLKDTIKIEKKGADMVVSVPAVRYDIDKFRKKGVIVSIPAEGSYAEEVNKTGGFSGKHEGYVETSIKEGIAEWCSLMGFNHNEEVK